VREDAQPSGARIAAGADLHARPGLEARLHSAVAQLEGLDLLLLAGDLTASGEVVEAKVLADALAVAPLPVVAVLGNHDHHGGHEKEISRVLEAAGVTMLAGAALVQDCRGVSVGIVGTKGFVGGFRESRMPDYGERLLREIYAATGREVDALEAGLTEVADADVRVVLLHYSPTTTTLRGERETVWTFLGSERLAGPISRHCPSLVFHGHAHAGAAEGEIGAVPVFNVAAPVIGGDFRIFENGVPGDIVRGVFDQAAAPATS
jgi:Icc-related predicted phosphoesterase